MAIGLVGGTLWHVCRECRERFDDPIILDWHISVRHVR